MFLISSGIRNIFADIRNVPSGVPVNSILLLRAIVWRAHCILNRQRLIGHKICDTFARKYFVDFIPLNQRM